MRFEDFRDPVMTNTARKKSIFNKWLIAAEFAEAWRPARMTLKRQEASLKTLWNKRQGRDQESAASSERL